MNVHSVLFSDTPTGANYERMAKVLEYTCARYSPATPLTLHRITAPDDDLIAVINKRPHARKQLYLDNVRKLKHHCQIVQEARDGEVLCLIDADTMVLGDLAAVEMDGIDILLTSRPPSCAYPLNTGVIFVRASRWTQRFCIDWQETAEAMLASESFHIEWKGKFGGITQAALGYLRKQTTADMTVRIADIPCSIWNCENDCLKRELFTEQTKVVHVHGNLRKVLFNFEQPYNRQVSTLAERWRGYEAAAMGAVA